MWAHTHTYMPCKPHRACLKTPYSARLKNCKLQLASSPGREGLPHGEHDATTLRAICGVVDDDIGDASPTLRWVLPLLRAKREKEESEEGGPKALRLRGPHLCWWPHLATTAGAVTCGPTCRRGRGVAARRAEGRATTARCQEPPSEAICAAETQRLRAICAGMRSRRALPCTQ